MKNFKYTFIFAAFAILLLAVCICDGELPPRELCHAQGVYDIITPEVISLYEREIAGEKVLSNMSQGRIEQTAKTLDISAEKAKAVILVQDFAGRVGRDISLTSLAKMNDFKLLNFCKSCIDDYFDGVPKDRQEELKVLFKNAIKNK